MAFKLYVGNYPHHFTEKDVLNLFRDFDGVRIEKISNFQSSETFSYLTCNDIDQLVSVIKKMNGTSVFGSDLIVKANDEKMQEYVNLILKDDETSVSEESLVPLQEMRNKCPPHHERNDYEKSDIYYKSDDTNIHFRKYSSITGVNSRFSVNKLTYPSRSMHNIYQQNHNGSDYETSSDNSCFSSNIGGKLNVSVKSDMYDKSDNDNIHFRKSPPKKEDSSGVSKNKSTSPSRSVHNIYQQKHNVSDCETSNNFCLFSKMGKKLNNHQTNSKVYYKSYKNNSSGNSLNSYQRSSDDNEDEHFKTIHNSFPKSLQKSYRGNEHEHFKTNSNHFSKSLQKSYHQNEHGYFKANYNNFPKLSEKSYHQNDHEHFPESSQKSYHQNEHEHSKTNSNHFLKSSQNSYYQTIKQPNFDYSVNSSLESQKYNKPKSDNNDHDQFKNTTNNFSGYSFNDTDSKASRIKNSKSFHNQRETSSPTWISVTNFRIGTGIKTFYELFSDYKPLRVRMICNEPRKNKLLTEAYLCFPSREIADDVILNFDNTLLEGRYILVNDVEDLTLMNELLHIKHL